MIKKIFMCLCICLLFIFTVSILVGGVGEGKLSIKSLIKDDVLKYDTKSSDLDLNSKGENNSTINVYISGKKEIINMGLEDYVRGVVCGEMEAEFNIEALKAQAVAARTFAVAHMEKFGGKKYKGAHGADVTDNVECQVYMDKELRLSEWPSKFREEYWNKVTEAVKETRGEVLTYNDKLVMEPLYFAISSGETEDASEVLNENTGYLKSVESKEDEKAPKYKTKMEISYIKFIDKISKEFPKNNLNLGNLKNNIQVISKNKTGSIKSIKVGSTTMTGSRFRSILGLNSTDFSVKYNANSIEFDCIGYGHGLGMSQWGAKGMADEGCKYTEILKHYYTGIEISKI
ncbi:stage II sporulation protein D [Clostridium hydrogenum]|uniref:stage II sporulation protein D n=1 Tax=Clostridium hydrogenum TaxID=2855764 RepID=UPI002E30F277|nr:stage II sporulation protein D [Clostridium hydrogenum]